MVKNLGNHIVFMGEFIDDVNTLLAKLLKELIEEYNDVNLVAALLQELVESNDDVDVQLTFEKPLSRGKGRQGKGGQILS